jgi:hypothetical protein
MKYLFILFLFVLSFHPNIFAQALPHDTSTDYNKLYKAVTEEYGFDQVLVNGIFYQDKYWNKVGHPFFLEDQLYKGTLLFRGKEYKSIEMKFDIYNQQLILYIQNNNSVVWIVPPNDFISAFSLGDKFFSKYIIQGEPGFYQVVFDTEKLKCLYYWFKQIHDTSNGGNSGSTDFSDSEKRNYLKIDGLFKKFKNNRSFTELFPKEIKGSVRQYIKTNHIKVTKSSDERITELLTYCNSLL